MGHEFHCTLEEITPEPEISATLFINPTSLSLFVVDLLFFRCRSIGIQGSFLCRSGM